MFINVNALHFTLLIKAVLIDLTDIQYFLVRLVGGRMSSMENSQDDAEQSSAQSKKLSAIHADTTQQNNNQSNPLNSVESFSDKLKKPLLGPLLSHKVANANHESNDSDNADHDLDSIKKKTSTTQVKQKTQVIDSGIVHPNFNPKTKENALDPDRPLSDIPPPAPRYKKLLNKLIHEAFPEGKEPAASRHSLQNEDQHSAVSQSNYKNASMWALIASPALASHLELLQLGGLINLPARFFEPIISSTSQLSIASKDSSLETDSNTALNNDKNTTLNNDVSSNKRHLTSDIKAPFELLSPLTEMSLLDMSDIHRVCAEYPNLTRYGFNGSYTKAPSIEERVNRRHEPVHNNETSPSDSIADLAASMPEMINDIFAPNWELILYPERFDNGVDSLTTDTLACSVAVHILKQCQTRQTVNRGVTAHQICQHMRSYVLSQCNIYPQFEQQYRQIRLFVGHVVVAARYLGLKITHATQHAQASNTNTKGEPSVNLGQPIYINISSRAALLNRYPNISSYYINGWS